MPSVKAVLRKEPNRRGEHALMLQVIIERKIKRYSLKQFIEPRFWNPAAQKVRPREGRAAHLNHLITKRLKEVQDIFHRFEVEGKALTPDSFAQVYRASGTTRNFYSFFEEELRTSGNSAHIDPLIPQQTDPPKLIG